MGNQQGKDQDFEHYSDKQKKQLIEITKNPNILKVEEYWMPSILFFVHQKPVLLLEEPIKFTLHLSKECGYSFSDLLQQMIKYISTCKLSITRIKGLSQFLSFDHQLMKTIAKEFVNFIVFQESNVSCMPRIRFSNAPLLDHCGAMFLNYYLPNDCRKEWTLLFNNHFNGNSWYQFIVNLVDKGSTLIVIKDKGGNVFGCFSNTNWAMKPNFYGSADSFLFQLEPEFHVFNSTGYNTNYQYLNAGKQTLLNGIGLGGQFEYFGLWIEESFERGHCKGSPCSTYGNSPLSSSEEFSIDTVEVWCVKPLEVELVEEKQSAMKANPDAMAILEMANRPSYHNYDE